MRALTPVRDLGLLIARVVAGIVLVAHGAQKLFTFGLDGAAASFEKMGVPAPAASALFSTVAELGGGILILLGAFVPVAGVLVMLDMLGAAALVHLPNGVFVADNGWELVGMIGTVALILTVVGPGRFSVDHILTRGRDHGAAARTHREDAGATRA